MRRPRTAVRAIGHSVGCRIGIGLQLRKRAELYWARGPDTVSGPVRLRRTTVSSCVGHKAFHPGNPFHGGSAQ